MSVWVGSDCVGSDCVGSDCRTEGERNRASEGASGHRGLISGGLNRLRACSEGLVFFYNWARGPERELVNKDAGEMGI